MFIVLSLFKTARQHGEEVAGHHLLVDVVNCSFELEECGMEGLTGRFPAVPLERVGVLMALHDRTDWEAFKFRIYKLSQRE